MSETLVVQDEEAYELARELAQRSGTSLERAVVASLRQALARVEPVGRPPQPAPFRIPSLEELTPNQREMYDRMQALAQEAAPYVVPGATSDHRDMYDEHGLPK